MNISCDLILSPLDAALVSDLGDLSEAVFGDDDRLDGIWRIENMPDLSCFLARCDDRLVGFKLAYAVTSRRYYSWLGGVHPQYRRQGVARALMHRQHDWIAQRGYVFVETEVRASNQAMAMLNMSCGFRAIGFKMVGDSPVIIYRKSLQVP